MAIILYKLGSCGDYGLVANQFAVHKSMVIKFVYMFFRSMMDKAIRQEVHHMAEDVPSQVVCQKPQALTCHTVPFSFEIVRVEKQNKVFSQFRNY